VTKKQLDEAQEEIEKLTAAKRRFKTELDEKTEHADSLERELQSLKVERDWMNGGDMCSQAHVSSSACARRRLRP
jgi:chromosome segregation ATPase